MDEDSPMGRVEVSPKAIAGIASQAVLSCYGVVGMAPTALHNGIAEVLQPDHYHRAVEAKLVDDQIVIDLYVVIEYGTRISEVAQNVMECVKFNVEKALNMTVAEVNVHVQGLRVSNQE